jgi:transcriptional regulator with XRE-family HTH domain
MKIPRTDQPFGTEVTRLLGQTGMSLRSLARETGVDPGFLSRVLRGKKPPSAMVLSEVGRVFGLPPDHFLEVRFARSSAALKASPKAADAVYDQISLEGPSLEEIVSLILEAPTTGALARLGAAVLLRYKEDPNFQAEVGQHRPEIEELAQDRGTPWRL